MVENEHIFRFSVATSSTVHVVSMAKVDEMAAFSTIDDSISRATRPSNVTNQKKTFPVTGLQIQQCKFI